MHSAPRWISGRLLEHFSKHGLEVELVKRVLPGSFDVKSYERSSFDSVRNYEFHFTATTPDRKPHKADYFLGSKSLLSITSHEKRPVLKTHFPIGAEGKKACNMLGDLPEEIRTIHGLRELYIRIKSERYIISSDKYNYLSEVLNKLVTKEADYINKYCFNSQRESSVLSTVKKWFFIDFPILDNLEGHCPNLNLKSLHYKLSDDSTLLEELAGEVRLLSCAVEAERLLDGVSLIPESCDKAFSIFRHFIILLETAHQLLLLPKEKQTLNNSNTISGIAKAIFKNYNSSLKRDYKRSFRSYFENWKKSETNSEISACSMSISQILKHLGHA